MNTRIGRLTEAGPNVMAVELERCLETVKSHEAKIQEAIYKQTRIVRQEEQLMHYYYLIIGGFLAKILQMLSLL